MPICRRIYPLFLAITAVSLTTARADGPAVVRGKVVTSDGQPAVGAKVSIIWSFEANSPKIHLHEPVTTDSAGQFQLDTSFYYGRSRAIMALDAAEQTGGLIVASEADAKAPVEIKLGPLVRVHGPVVSAAASHPLKTVGAIAMMDNTDHTSVAQWFSFRIKDRQDVSKREPGALPECQMMLPAGKYLFNFYEPSEPAEHLGAAARIEVKADQPGLDRPFKNPIKLELSPIARLSHQAPPALAIKDARGVAKDVKLADFKGKWVVLEFWTTTCGPCIGRGLPTMMNFWDDYADSRDKFTVLAIHGPGADDMADLDRKLVPIFRDTWNGRNLPFPSLIDDDGKTFEAFGVQAIPMTVVINPAGQIEPAGIAALYEALPEPPAAVQVARVLDRETLHFAMNGVGVGQPLGETIRDLGGMTNIEIHADLDAWKSVGLTPETRVPLSVVGPVSLRTWLRLLFEPVGLVAVADPDGLLITTPRAGSIPFELPAALASKTAERIQRHLDSKLTLAVPTRPLADVLDVLSQRAGDAFVLDPTARKLGTIDPKTPVSLDIKDAQLGPALKAMLAPLRLEAVIRDDIILIRLKP